MASEILRGVVGSQAYGLAHADSDTDRLAIHVAATRDVLGLSARDAISETIHTTNPDFTSHELGKFCTLALRANPTLLELLYLTEYETSTPAGQLLVDNHNAFLSTRTVRASYGGYAHSEAERIKRLHAHVDTEEAKHPDRIAKRARHALRVTIQGLDLLTTGTLTLDMSDHRDAIFAAGDMAVRDPDEFATYIEKQIATLDATTSVLPEDTDYGVVDRLVYEIRSGYALKDIGA